MDDILACFDAASPIDQFAALKVLSINWLLELYEALPETEREALDEMIMNQGISDLESLLDTLQMVETYFQEQ